MDNDNVEVVFDGCEGKSRQEHRFFQCCHIGMVFFTSDLMEDYRQMEFNLSFPEDDGSSGAPINCKGVVVDSDYDEERGLYKTCLLYIDIDDNTKKRLEKVTKEKDLRCPYCLRS